MNEHQNHQSRPSDHNTPQVPHSLLPSLLACLNLDEATRLRDTSLEGLKKALAHPEWTERAATVQALAEMSEPGTFELLLSALHDEDVSVRAGVVCALGKRGDPQDRMVLACLEEALHDPNWHVRETTVFALGMLGARVPTEALVAALQDEDSRVQKAARMVLQQRRLSSVSEQIHAPTGQGSAGVQAHKDIPQRSRQRMYALLHTITQQLPGEKRDMQRKQIGSDDVAEMERPLAGMISPLQARPKARPLFRLMQGGLALLVIMSITLSLWVVAQHFQSGRRSPISTHGKQSVPPGDTAVVRSIFTDHFSSPFYPYDAWSADSQHFLYSKTDSSITTLNVATGQHQNFPVSKFTIDPTEGGKRWLSMPLMETPDRNGVGHYFILTNLSHVNGEWISSIEFWDIVTGKKVFSHAFPAPISPSGPTVTAGMEAFFMNNLAMALSYDSEELAIFNSDGTIDIWNVKSGQKSITLVGHEKLIESPTPASLVWFPDGKHIYLNHHGYVQVWDTTTGQKTLSFSYPASPAYADNYVTVSPDSQYFAIVSGPASNVPTSGTTSIQIRNATTGAQLKTYHKENLAWQQIDWLPDSTHFIVTYAGTAIQKVEVWNVFTGQTTLETMFSSGYGALSYYGYHEVANDGKYIVLGGVSGKTSEVWDTLTGRRVTTIDIPFPLSPMSPTTKMLSFWSIAGNHIALIGKDTLWVWNMLTGKLLYTTHLAPVHGDYELLWSPDGSYFAVISDKHTIDAPARPQEHTLQVWRIS